MDNGELDDRERDPVTETVDGGMSIELACHPAAALFPLLQGDAYDRLVADLRQHSLREPGWLDRDGRILDGRNRQRACRELGIKMSWRKYEGVPGTETEFVVSLNLHRRHLTDDQRAAIAAELATVHQGQRTDLSPNGGMSQADAAKVMQVSTRRVQRAAAVKRNAPKVHADVKAGRVKLRVATKRLAGKKRTTTKKTPAEKITTDTTVAPSTDSPPLTVTIEATSVVPTFTVTIDTLETTVRALVQCLHEIAASDRAQIVAVIARAEAALRDLTTALAPTEEHGALVHVLAVTNAC